jgi:hypothetical protein
MRYFEFKEVCQSGDIIAVSHQEWGTISDIESQIVRMATESEYSHVAVVWKDKNGEPYVLEATVPSVGIHPIGRYLKNGFYWIQMADKPMTSEEESYGFAHIGDSYSKIQAVEGFFNMLDIAQDRKWQCSELTISMRRLSGVDLGPTATPADVVRKAMSLGYTLTFVEV